MCSLTLYLKLRNKIKYKVWLQTCLELWASITNKKMTFVFVICNAHYSLESLFLITLISYLRGKSNGRYIIQFLIRSKHENPKYKTITKCTWGRKSKLHQSLSLIIIIIIIIIIVIIIIFFLSKKETPKSVKTQFFFFFHSIYKHIYTLTESEIQNKTALFKLWINMKFFYKIFWLLPIRRQWSS